MASSGKPFQQETIIAGIAALIALLLVLRLT